MSNISFNWIDDNEEGKYVCTMYEGNTPIQTIEFTDYSNPTRIKYDKRHRIKRACAYIVLYRPADLNTKGIYKTLDANNTDSTSNGYSATSIHSIPEIKRWCENYLAAIYIRKYEDVIREMQTLKNRAEELMLLGYTSNTELK